jgi:hypothetical protein
VVTGCGEEVGRKKKGGAVWTLLAALTLMLVSRGFKNQPLKMQRLVLKSAYGAVAGA